MNLFYTTTKDEHNITLEEEEARHCTQVLRHKTGDQIFATDGNGKLFKCVLRVISKHSCEAEIIAIEEEKQVKPFIHIAVAPTKNSERLEWFLEKATEIGIDEVSLVFCEHSERRIVKTDRIKKVLVSAIKQSFRFTLPKLNEPISFNEFIQTEWEIQKFIAHQQGIQSLKKACSTSPQSLIFIGPEGDFSEKELDAARVNNFSVVTLGGYRLRTETAALVACQTIHLMHED